MEDTIIAGEPGPLLTSEEAERTHDDALPPEYQRIRDNLVRLLNWDPETADLWVRTEMRFHREDGRVRWTSNPFLTSPAQVPKKQPPGRSLFSKLARR